MSAPWSVHPLHPSPGKPATAVCIHADDATVREGVYELARSMTVQQFDDLRASVKAYDLSIAELGHKYAEPIRVQMDLLLDEVCRERGSDLSGLWRVRVGVEEAGGFWSAVWRATDPPAVREGQPNHEETA